MTPGPKLFYCQNFNLLIRGTKLFRWQNWSLKIFFFFLHKSGTFLTCPPLNVEYTWNSLHAEWRRTSLKKQFNF